MQFIIIIIKLDISKCSHFLKESTSSSRMSLILLGIPGSVVVVVDVVGDFIRTGLDGSKLL